MVGMARRVTYEDWADSDYIWDLCTFVYAARSFGENKLEEDLYIQLLEIFRSTEALARATRCDPLDDHNFHKQCTLEKHKKE